uniref:Uncharacterized protein n=1 Tax=Ciona savignyi TaxID=51511 RepID=H2ZP26_CIOSA
MNIGDGLTIQTRSIGGKVTKGIFLLPQDKPQTKKNFKSQNQKFPKNQEVTGKAKFERPKINVPRPRKKPVKIDDDILFVTDQEPTKDRKDVESRNKSQTQLKIPKNEKIKTEPPRQKPLSTRNRNQNASNNKPKRVIKSPAEQIKVDTSFVTLTQDQLNTILSLVKTKQDIDVAQIINKEAMPQNEDNKNQNEDTEDKKENEEGEVHNEPSAVPGLDLDEPTENVEVMQKDGGKSRTNSAKSNRGTKPDDPRTSRSKMFDTIGGIGSRERDRDMLEQKRRQWVKDLNEQVNSKNSK